MTQTHELLTTQEAAKRLRVTPSGISRMVNRGALTPAMKSPGTRGAFFFDPADVESLANQKADA